MVRLFSRKYSNSSKKKLTAAFIILLLFIITLIILEKTHTTDFVHMPAGKSQSGAIGPTEEQKAVQTKVDSESKQQYLDKASAQSQSPATQPAMTNSSLSLTASQSGNTVTVLTKIQGISAGNCALTISSGGKSNEQTAQVIYQPEFSSCAGFTVPISSLGAGNWNITVKVSPDTGEAVQQSTSLEVR